MTTLPLATRGSKSKAENSASFFGAPTRSVRRRHGGRQGAEDGAHAVQHRPGGYLAGTRGSIELHKPTKTTCERCERWLWVKNRS